MQDVNLIAILDDKMSFTILFFFFCLSENMGLEVVTTFPELGLLAAGLIFETASNPSSGKSRNI